MITVICGTFTTISLYLGSFLLFLRHNVEFDDAGKELAKFPARFFDVFTGGIGYFFVTGG